MGLLGRGFRRGLRELKAVRRGLVSGAGPGVGVCRPLDAAALVRVLRGAARAGAGVPALGCTAAPGVVAEGCHVGAGGVHLHGDLVALPLAAGAGVQRGVDVADGGELAGVAVLGGGLDGAGGV